MTEEESVNWDSMEEASIAISDWADRTFPGRSPKASLLKLNMEEIPELLTHLKTRGTSKIGDELADCFILLLDLSVIWNVDLKKAIAHKMQINNHRMWVKDNETGFFNHVVITQTVDQSGADAARGRPAGFDQAGPGPETLDQKVDER
jgi:NTP pyrophosphatase (non-canonical NTP hydrolase)